MHFTKMQGLGNDYIYVDTSREKVEDPSRLAALISDRHFGIGSDGLILINPSSKADFEMEMYNADGSRGKMCGNGIRCVGKYVYDHHLTDKTTLTIETLSGIRTLKLYPGSDGRIDQVKVDMGEPVLKAAEIPMDLPMLRAAGLRHDEDTVVNFSFAFGKTDHAVTCVSMGNPHCVIFPGEDVASLPIEKTGPVIEHSPLFPEGVNTEFVNVLAKDHIRMRVWERGSGETFACGTGACAAAVASALNGFTGRTVTVSLLGGDLHIDWQTDTGRVFMTGPAVEVYSGDI